MMELNFSETSNGETLNENVHFMGQDKSQSLEIYKFGIAKTLMALKFMKYDKEMAWWNQ